MPSTKTESGKYTPRLKTLIKAQAPVLMEELNVKNVMQLPRLSKVVINVGLGKAKDDKRMFEVAGNTLAKITGQKPVEIIAKKSIASFKLREGNKVGLCVTLRGDKMYEFADRFINIVLPRVRDFHGVSAKSFDKSGNFAIGLKDQSIFPELSFEETSVAHGLQVIFVLDIAKPEHGRALLEKIGMPFEKARSDK